MIKLPEDGIRAVLDNVFDFDKLDVETMEVVSTIFERNGIILGKHHSHFVINVATPTALSDSDIDMADIAVESSAEHVDPVQAEAIIDSSLKQRNVSFLLEEKEIEQEYFRNMRAEGHISEFSEQLLEFHAVGTKDEYFATKPLRLCSSTDDHLYVLTHSTPYVTRTHLHQPSHTRVLDLDRLLGTSVGSSPTLQLFALSQPTSVCVVAPNYGKLFRIDFGSDTATAFHYELPPEFGAVVSRLPTRGDRVDVVGAEGDTVVLAKEDKLLRVDLTTSVAKTYLLPKGTLQVGSKASLIRAYPSLEVVAENVDGAPRMLITHGQADQGPEHSVTRPIPAQGLSNAIDVRTGNRRVRGQVGAKKLEVIDVRRKSRIELNTRSGVIDCSFFDNGDKVAILCEDGIVRVYEVDQEKLSAELEKWIDQFGVGSAGLEQDIELYMSFRHDSLAADVVQGQEQADDDGVGIYRIPSNLAGTLSAATGGGGGGGSGSGGGGE